MENSSLLVNALQSILDWASHHVVEIIIFLSIFVEVSKIKFSPISSLIKFIFKPIRNEIAEMRKEFKKEIDDLRTDLTTQIESIKEDQIKEVTQIQELVYSNEMSEISRIRWEIIEFSNSIENGQLHVRDEYRHVKDEYKKYESLIDKYDLKNGIVTEEIEKIQKHYEENRDTSSVYF
jgi:hypothetical protein